MPEAKQNREYKMEAKNSNFKMFVNGKLNLNIPPHYNWALGCSNPPMGSSFNRRAETLTISHSRINGQHIIL